MRDVLIPIFIVDQDTISEEVINLPIFVLSPATFQRDPSQTIDVTSSTGTGT